MSLEKKNVSRTINILLTNILLFLVTNDNVKAEEIKYSYFKLALKQSSSKTEALTFNSSGSFAIAQTVPEETEQAPSDNNGSPSLRRRPIDGQLRFEPKRIPLKIPFRQTPYRASPSISIINPSGYGAAWGNAGIGVGFQRRARFRDQADGIFGFGFGLGDPRKNIGAQVGIGLVDLNAPSQDGVINLKLHRRLSRDLSVAIGTQGIITWGDPDGGSSVFGVATKRFGLRQDRTKTFSEIYTSLGIGGGQFRSESDINNGNETVGVFSSIALRVIEPMAFVTEWTGQDLTIGTPIVPFRNISLVIVPSVTDITGSAGDGARFIFGVGYTFSY